MDDNVLTMHPPIGPGYLEVFPWPADDLRGLLVCIQGDGVPTIGITAEQARELAAHLVRCAVHLENPTAAGWIEAALTIGLIINPTKPEVRA